MWILLIGIICLLVNAEDVNVLNHKGCDDDSFSPVKAVILQDDHTNIIQCTVHNKQTMLINFRIASIGETQFHLIFTTGGMYTYTINIHIVNYNVHKVLLIRSIQISKQINITLNHQVNSKQHLEMNLL